MNDFTKEELREIHSALCDRHADIEDFVPIQPLRIKIQSLIDNYCEHSNKQFYEMVDGYECNKCHMVLI